MLILLTHIIHHMQGIFYYGLIIFLALLGIINIFPKITTTMESSNNVHVGDTASVRCRVRFSECPFWGTLLYINLVYISYKIKISECYCTVSHLKLYILAKNVLFDHNSNR